MVSAQILRAYDEIFDYLASKVSPEDILAFKVSEKAQARATKLLDKNNAGTLTPEERNELDLILHFDGKVAVLKVEAAAKLNP
jgi:hypothetical protein